MRFCVPFPGIYPRMAYLKRGFGLGTSGWFYRVQRSFPLSFAISRHCW
jgi:hypothetical protein